MKILLLYATVLFVAADPISSAYEIRTNEKQQPHQGIPYDTVNLSQDDITSDESKEEASSPKEFYRHLIRESDDVNGLQPFLNSRPLILLSENEFPVRENINTESVLAPESRIMEGRFTSKNRVFPSALTRVQDNRGLLDGYNRVHLNDDEEAMIQKRLKMRGSQLLRSLGSNRRMFGMKKGLSQGKPKSMVLSIDLGIKALRDAIIHAQAEQENRHHQMQAQQNMELLHNIGKRRAI